jgi:hypothetical protein
MALAAHHHGQVALKRFEMLAEGAAELTLRGATEHVETAMAAVDERANSGYELGHSASTTAGSGFTVSSTATSRGVSPSSRRWACRAK